jgi:hypothetical protein
MSNDLDMNSNDILNANGIDTQSLTIAGQTIVSSDDVTTTQVEVKTLVDGQTDVVFTNNTTNGTFYLNGLGADRGRLVQGTDYNITHSTKTLSLIESYPAGTQLIMVYFEGENATQFFAKGTGLTGGAGSAGAGNQYIELEINGVTYKILHDGTV